jgi:hypothetical protein
MSIANLNNLKLQQTITNAGVGIGCPAGMICPYAGQDLPVGWLDCDGTAISVEEGTGSTALYSVIGTTYGGDYTFVGTATQTGNLLDVLTAVSGDIAVGSLLNFNSAGTLTIKVLSFGTGTGGVGTYLVDKVNDVPDSTGIRGAVVNFYLPNLNDSAYNIIRGSTSSEGDTIDGTTAPATFTLVANNIPQCPVTFTSGLGTTFNDYTFYNAPANSLEDLNNWVLTPNGNQGYFLKGDTSQRNGITTTGASITACEYVAPSAPTAVDVNGLGAKALLMRYLIKL